MPVTTEGGRLTPEHRPTTGSACACAAVGKAKAAVNAAADAQLNVLIARDLSKFFITELLNTPPKNSSAIKYPALGITDNNDI